MQTFRGEVLVYAVAALQLFLASASFTADQIKLNDRISGSTDGDLDCLYGALQLDPNASASVDQVLVLAPSTESLRSIDQHVDRVRELGIAVQIMNLESERFTANRPTFNQSSGQTVQSSVGSSTTTGRTFTATTKDPKDLIILAWDIGALNTATGLPHDRIPGFPEAGPLINSKRLKYFRRIILGFLQPPTSQREQKARSEILLSLQRRHGIDHFVQLRDTMNKRQQRTCLVEYVCLYCCTGETCLKRDWKYGFEPITAAHDHTPARNEEATDFKPKFAWPPRFNGNFNGAKLATSYFNIFRNWFITGTDDKGNPRYEGMDYRMTNILAKAMNFSFTVLENKEKAWGATLPNGSHTGLLGMLHRKDIDFSMSTLAIHLSREKVVDFTLPYEYQGFYICEARPRIILSGAWGITKPFGPLVWMMIVILALVTLFFAVLVRVTSGKPPDITDTAFGLYKSFVNQGEPEEELRKPGDKGKRVLLAWWGFSVIASVSYSTLLYTQFVQPTLTPTTDTLNDLIRSQKRWIALTNSYQQQVAEYPPLKKLAILVPYPEIKLWVSVIKDDPSVTIMIPRTPRTSQMLPHPGVYEAMRQSEYYVGKDTVADLWPALALQDNSPLLDAFNKVLLRSFETGVTAGTENLALIKSNLGEVTYEQLRHNQLIRKRSHGEATAALTLREHFSGAFWILLIGYVLAAIGFSLEHIFRRYFDRSSEDPLAGSEEVNQRSSNISVEINEGHAGPSNPMQR